MTIEKEVHFIDAEGNIYSAFFGPTIVEDEPEAVYEDLWSTRVTLVDEKHNATSKLRPAHHEEGALRLEFFNDENEMLHFFNEWPLRRMADDE